MPARPATRGTSSTCSAMFADGTAVSLSATSAAGSKFSGWGGNCSGPGACSITLQADAQVHRMQNRVDAVIASGQNQVLGVAVDATQAYFTCAALDGTDRAIRRVPRKGGAVETVVTTSFAPLVVRVDSENVYYRASNTSLWAFSKSGGPQRQLSAANGSNGIATVDFDINAFAAWWIWMDTSSAPKGLFRANADGTGFTAVDTSSDFGWSGPRVDDTAAYYFHAGALLKRLK